MPNFFNAIEKKIIDNFIMKSPDLPNFLTGQLVGCDEKNIYVTLSHSVGNESPDECNLKFYGNRLPFQVQHQALKYVKKHKLFDKLIAKSRYENDESQFKIKFDLKFRYFFCFAILP